MHVRRFPTTAWLLLAAAFIGGFGAGFAGGGDRKALAKDEPLAPVTPATIDAAIERGVAWLVGDERRPGDRGEQDRDGAFSGGDEVGHTCLAALALLHAGLREEGTTKGDKALAAALRWLDRNGPGRRANSRDAGTYATSLMLLVLRARGRAEDHPRMQRLADLLSLTQAKNGQWGYSGVPAHEPRGGPDVGDNSNTHLAVFAVGAAVGEGLEVPERVLLKARMWWHACTQDDGGFGYSSGGALRTESSGSMTAAGIACLATLRAALGDEGSDTITQHALDRLGRSFSVERNFGPEVNKQAERQRAAGRGWLHYYLWTVERALVLSGQPVIAGRDWYAEGTAHLLKSQYDDGSWRAEMPLYATCFALLFLSRAADRPRNFTAPPSAGPVTAADHVGDTPKAPMPRDPPPPGGPDAWLRDGTPPITLRDHCLAMGSASLAPLVKALDDADPAVRRRAFECLSMLLDDHLVAGADVRPLPRGRLGLWVRKNARILVIQGDRFKVP